MSVGLLKTWTWTRPGLPPQSSPSRRSLPPGAFNSPALRTMCTASVNLSSVAFFPATESLFGDTWMTPLVGVKMPWGLLRSVIAGRNLPLSELSHS